MGRARNSAFFSTGLLTILMAALPVHAQPWGAAPVELGTGWQYKYTARDTVVLEEPWDAPGWQPLTMPLRLAPDDDIQWLRIRLPEGTWRDPTLRLESVIGNFELYLDGTLLLTEPPEGLDYAFAGAPPWLLIPLPPDSGGKVLTFRTFLVYRRGGVAGVPVLGNRADHVTWAVRNDWWRVVTGALMILVAILGALFLLRRHDWRAPLGFVLTTGALGWYVLFHTNLKELLWPGPMMWMWAWLVGIPLVSIGLLLFVDNILEDAPHRLFRRLLRLHVTWFVLTLIVDVLVMTVLTGTRDTGLRRLGEALFIVPHLLLRAMVAFTAVIALWKLGRVAWRGDRDAQIFVGAALVMMLTMIDATIAEFGPEEYRWQSQLHLGAFSFCVALIVLVRRRYELLSRKAAAYAMELRAQVRDKELMMRELHDGLGGLATNIRMLAELGQRNQTRSQSALEKILGLAGEAVVEVRAFVVAREDGWMDWPALIAELRRQGAQLLEPGEQSLELHTDISTMHLPTPRVCLNLVRVFREALVNAAKHGGPGPVVVTIRINHVRFEMTVDNPPRQAPSRAGINSGRGVNNVRNRIQELGGEVSLDVGERVRLTLWFPVQRASSTSMSVAA